MLDPWVKSEQRCQFRHKNATCVSPPTPFSQDIGKQLSWKSLESRKCPHISLTFVPGNFCDFCVTSSPWGKQIGHIANIHFFLFLLAFRFALLRLGCSGSVRWSCNECFQCIFFACLALLRRCLGCLSGTSQTKKIKYNTAPKNKKSSTISIIVFFTR